MSRLLAHERDSTDTMHVRRCAAHWRRPGVEAAVRARTDARRRRRLSCTPSSHRPQRRPRWRPRRENVGEVGAHPTRSDSSAIRRTRETLRGESSGTTFAFASDKGTFIRHINYLNPIKADKRQYHAYEVWAKGGMNVFGKGRYVAISLKKFYTRVTQ